MESYFLLSKIDGGSCRGQFDFCKKHSVTDNWDYLSNWAAKASVMKVIVLGAVRKVWKSNEPT